MAGLHRVTLSVLWGAVLVLNQGCSLSASQQIVLLDSPANAVRFELTPSSIALGCPDNCFVPRDWVVARQGDFTMTLQRLDANDQPDGTPLAVLRDDGTGSDSVAGDGILTGEWTPPTGQRDSYRVQAVEGGIRSDVFTLVVDDQFTQLQLNTAGETVYAQYCAGCHRSDGSGGGFPALDGSPVVNGPLAPQADIILNGSGGMPAWRDRLDDLEVAAVITYTRNAWNNQRNETVQASDVTILR